LFASPVEQTRFVQIPLYAGFTHGPFAIKFLSAFLYVKYYKRLKKNKVVIFALGISWKFPRSFSGLMSGRGRKGNSCLHRKVKHCAKN